MNAIVRGPDINKVTETLQRREERRRDPGFANSAQSSDRTFHPIHLYYNNFSRFLTTIGNDFAFDDLKFERGMVRMIS